MTYLRKLPITELKLAATFIEELQPAPPGTNIDAQIVRSILSLAHNLGITVTAEGVETAETGTGPARPRLRHGPGLLLRAAGDARRHGKGHRRTTTRRALITAAGSLAARRER